MANRFDPKKEPMSPAKKFISNVENISEKESVSREETKVIRIKKTLYDRLRRLGFENEKPINSYANEAIEEYLNKK